MKFIHNKQLICKYKDCYIKLFIFILFIRIVRLLDTSSSSSNQNVVHKIRIQYFDRRKPQDLLGKRDITCTILSYKPSEENFDEDQNHLSNRMKTPVTTTSISTNSSSQDTRKYSII